MDVKIKPQKHPEMDDTHIQYTKLVSSAKRDKNSDKKQEPEKRHHTLFCKNAELQNYKQLCMWKTFKQHNSLQYFS